MNAPGMMLRARYAWHHSDHPMVLGARGTINARLLPFVSAVSAAGPEAPSLGYAGVPHGLGQVLHTLEVRREAAGAVATPTERSRVHRADLFGGALPATDLVAVGCAPAQVTALPLRSALVLPFRMHHVVDVSCGQDTWRRAISRRERQWFSARRNESDWALEVAVDEDAFRFFYHQMHLPTMRSRHGEWANTEPEDIALECLFRSGVLVFVTVNGERLAGALCRRSKDDATITLRLLGVLDGAKKMYEIGTLKGLYHLLLEWADGHGIRQVDLGGSGAWLSSGLFQWKRRFAPEIVDAPNHLGRLRVWFHARRNTAAVRDFLVANPVLEITGDREFGAVYFHDDHRPARLALAYASPNVRKHRTVHLDDFLPPRGTS